MAHTPQHAPTPRPTSLTYRKEGWLPAILTIIASIVIPATAYYIHTQTFRDPRDIMMRQVGEGQKAAGGAHEAPAGH
jgi:hypothetical protein